MANTPAPLKNYSAYFLLSAIGLIIFLTIAFTFTFKAKVFQAFKRPLSLAQEEVFPPKVDLIAGAMNSFRIGVLNVENGKSNITLRWKTENDPKICIGRFWSNVKSSDGWTGVKDVKGGTYTVTDNLQTGIYIYSIGCSNEFGDSAGSSITINVGAKQGSLQPHIVSFGVFSDNGQKYDINKQIQVSKDTGLKIAWSSLNADTPYGICVASGSWPTIYKNSSQREISEEFVLDQAKVYQYKIFCSNEYGYDQRQVLFIVK